MSRPASRLETPEAVARIIELLSGDRPLDAAEACLDPAVIIHVDGVETHRGLPLWKRWVHLMRERGRLRDLRFERQAVDVDGDLVRVTFRWSGRERRGRCYRSARCQPRNPAQVRSGSRSRPRGSPTAISASGADGGDRRWRSHG